MISLIYSIGFIVDGIINQNPIYYVAAGLFVVSYQLYRLRNFFENKED